MEKENRWKRSRYLGLLNCPKCHDCYIEEDWLKGNKWNYCPNCGSKLRGDTAEEIIHCEDCEHSTVYYEGGNLHCKLARGDYGDDFKISVIAPKHYCGKAVRKSNKGITQEEV